MSANLQSEQVVEFNVYKFHLKHIFITPMKIITQNVINPIAFSNSSQIYFENEKAWSLNIFIPNFSFYNLNLPNQFSGLVK